MKNIRNRTRSQEYKKSPTPKKVIIKDPDSFFLQMDNKERDAFNYLLALSNTNKHIYVTQSTIAAKVGLSRKTINEYIRSWEEDGLVHTIYRHMTSCVYRVSHWFAEPMVRSRDKGIGYIFSALDHPTILQTFFSLSLLMQPLLEPVTQLKCINKSLNLSSYERVTVGHKSTKNFDYRNEGGRRMNEAQLPTALDSLRSLKLTLAGKIRLAVFSNETLRYADQRMPQQGVAKPFEYFYKIAFQKAIADKKAPNHSLFRELSTKHNIQPSDSSLIVSQPSATPNPSNIHKEERPGAMYNEKHQPQARRVNNFESRVNQKRTVEQVIQQVQVFDDWQKSEDGKKFEAMFGSIKPFWLDELREEQKK